MMLACRRFSSGRWIFKFVGRLTLENASYNMPCYLKHFQLSGLDFKSTPADSNVFPWYLWTVIANADLTKNWWCCMMHLSCSFHKSRVILSIRTSWQIVL